MKSSAIRWSNTVVAIVATGAIAFIVAAGDVSAAQAFGRDSVYAWSGSAPSGSSAIGTRARSQTFGRDSVYALGGGPTRVAATVKTRIDRHAGAIYGRAGGPAPLFNSAPKAA